VPENSFIGKFGPLIRNPMFKAEESPGAEDSEVSRGDTLYPYEGSNLIAG